ncbi:MAG TPA: hypothetical protein VFI24_15960 [Pyrinomonadaceae bacterium]|nr:hypothetical protein [Pyrinomonadaceae bacterium]
MKFNIPNFITILGTLCVLSVGMLHGASHQDFIENQLPESGRFNLPKSWKNLNPLQTTREEVEHVLGLPTSSAGSRQSYENDTERVDVVYSNKKCEAVAGRWNVAPNVVIVMEIYPKKHLFLNDLIFNKKKYIRQPWSHPSDWVTYRNKSDGIEIETINYGRNAEEIRRFSFGPKTKDEHLRCNN